MKKKFLAAIILLLISAVFLLTGAAAPSVKKGEETVIQKLEGNVVSPPQKNTVVLKGTPGENSPYFYNIKIEILDAKGKIVTTIKPSVSEGYDPSIMLGDFGVEKGVQQIFYGASTGGSGGFGYFDLFSAKNGRIEKLFDTDKFDKENRYKGRFLDNYRAEIIRVGGKEKYIIDLSGRNKEYKDEIWRPDGKLKAPREIDISGVNTVFPYFNYATGNFHLLVYQRVTGLFNADGLGYILSQQSYRDGRFQTYFTGMMIFPSDYPSKEAAFIS